MLGLPKLYPEAKVFRGNQMPNAAKFRCAKLANRWTPTHKRLTTCTHSTYLQGKRKNLMKYAVLKTLSEST